MYKCVDCINVYEWVLWLSHVRVGVWIQVRIYFDYSSITILFPSPFHIFRLVSYVAATSFCGWSYWAFIYCHFFSVLTLFSPFFFSIRYSTHYRCSQHTPCMWGDSNSIFPDLDFSVVNPQKFLVLQGQVWWRKRACLTGGRLQSALTTNPKPPLRMFRFGWCCSLGSFWVLSFFTGRRNNWRVGTGRSYRYSIILWGHSTRVPLTAMPPRALGSTRALPYHHFRLQDYL